MLSVFVSGSEELDAVVDMPLEVGKSYVVGRSPLVEDDGIQIEADGVSRRHLMLTVLRDAVEAEDLGSSYGTTRNGIPVNLTRIADRPATLVIGDARLVVTPPLRGDATELRHERRITVASLRRILVILCRDHVVAPGNRGAWILTDEEISAVLGGTPNAGTVGKDLKRVAATVGLEAPATRESIIDWAIASREVSQADAHELDAYLTLERGLPSYDDRIRTFERSTRLRRNLGLRPGGL
jgi:pSer/pThr/pTyr-binding forkhead associated (FHA) protein